MTCKTCNKEISPSCDHNQGRCPHSEPLINIDNFMKHPDPKLHRNISFAKSALRIIAAYCLAANMFVSAGTLFALAEALGIVEEMV